MNTIISAAAVASATALPLPASASDNALSPDLAARFARLERFYHAQNAKDQRIMEASKVAFFAATGMS